MRKLVLLTVAAALFAAPSTSRAQTSIGLRAGYAQPFGQAGGSTALPSNESDFISEQIPAVQLDLVYRLFFGFELGVYGSYGVGEAGSGSCGGPITCQNATVYRAGAQAAFTFPIPFVKPWIGAGLGYEWATVDRSGAKNLGARGPEKFNLQGGVDLAVANVRFGPFVTVTQGDYLMSSSKTSGAIASDVSDTTSHGWLLYGLRFRYDL